MSSGQDDPNGDNITMFVIEVGKKLAEYCYVCKLCLLSLQYSQNKIHSFKSPKWHAFTSDIKYQDLKFHLDH